MTSVTCNVCSQSIGSENDRIYCFGGCEQILHTRCSDLSLAGAKAIQENNALKYMCFDCRKRQTTLNDIQKQCSQLAKAVDELSDYIKKNNLMLPGLIKAEVNKNNAVLLQRILSASKDINARCMNSATTTFEKVDSDKPSYANIVQNANGQKGKKRKALDDLQSNDGKRKISSENISTVALNGNDTAYNFEEGGLLRSGKRRINANQVNGNSISTPVLQPFPPDCSQSPRSPQRKSSAVLKMEQTVLIKPNQVQSAEITKSFICGKHDPIEFAVKELHLRESGEVAVRCESKDLALNLVKAASDNFSVSTQKPL